MTNIRSDKVGLPPEYHPRRNLFVLLLDASGSMGPEFKPTTPTQQQPIVELNLALNAFVSGPLHQIDPLERNGEIAIGVFRNNAIEWINLGARAESQHPFYYCARVESVPRIEASGNTPVAEAIEAGLTAVANRKASLNSEGRLHEFRPNMIMITDGKPSTKLSPTVQRLRVEENRKHVLFFILGTGNADANVLTSIARPEAYYPMHEATIGECLEFVSNSLGADSAGVDDGPDSAYLVVRNRFREHFNKQNQQSEDFLRS